ncbi:MAG: hypothetical protein WBA76_14960 [Phormidesmis sp.]
MDRIQIKASKLWDLLFADQTAEIYQKALNLTGTIIKEFAQLIWLIICSVFVFGAWFSDTSVRAGKSIREWINSSGSETSSPNNSPNNSQSVTEKGKSLLDRGRIGIVYLLNQAREQLGIEPEEMPAIERTANAIKPDSAKAVPTSTAAPAPSTPAPASASTSAPSASTSEHTSSASAPSASTSAPSASTSEPSASTSEPSASTSEPPTVDPFARPANPHPSDKPSVEPSSQTVGSSRGAGSQSFSSAPEEIIREDDDGGWSGSQDDS